MKFASSLLLSCTLFMSIISSAQAKYHYENGMKFYVMGNKDKASHQPQRKRSRTSRSSENPLATLVKHTFVHLIPVWGGTKCGSKLTEIMVPDSFTSPMGGVDFSKSCAIHDACYGAQKGRGFCDRQIHTNLLTQCRRAFPEKDNHLRSECVGYSNLYYRTISSFGMIGYNAAQSSRRVTRSYHRTQKNARTAAQWITGRKRIRFNR